jgi:hypothetical protein
LIWYMNKIVFHRARDRDWVLDVKWHSASPGFRPELTAHYAIMHSESQGCLTGRWFSSPVQ